MEENDTIEGELLYIIQRFLSVGPCQQAAQVLKYEIERYKLLPDRIDFEGNSHARSFNDYDRCLNNLLPRIYLKRLCSRLPPLLNTIFPPGNLNVKLSLIGTGKYSLLREEKVVNTKLGNDLLYALQSHRKCVQIPRKKICSIDSLLSSRQFTGINNELTRRLCSDTFLVSHVNFHKRIFGHLSSVFCVAFDRSGQYILTGADDHLIKLWLVENGRLLFTFRGLSGEVTDLTVSHENTLLAAGSCDKTIRVWCLRTGSPVAVLQGHSAMVTTLQFLPYVNGDDRWLLSTGNDCCVCFWKWNVKTNKFILEPVKYPERLRVSGQMVCSSHSPGGRFIVAGGTDYYVRVYVIRDGRFPERIIETEGHTDRVSTVQWAHKGLKFATGSRDGVAKIWKFCRQEWHTKPLIMDKRYENGKGLVPITANDPKNLKLKVTMLTWSADDSLIVSAVSDMTLRVWDASSGDFLRLLLNHTDEIFVLEPHPLNPKIILSAAHDGRLLLWDITTGEMKKKHFNEIENHGHGAFFDARFGPDGEKIAAVDSHGYLSIFGAGDNQNIRSAVTEQFFHTDYRPLIRDANQYVLDEQTQLAPHLMPPPFLVNSDGDPHPPAVQRHVPGRENFSDDFLVPVVVRNSEDDANEILDLGDNDNINSLSELSSRITDRDGNPDASISQTSMLNGTANPSRRSRPIQRRWSVWLSRCLVRPLKLSILEAGNKLRIAFGVEELAQYDLEQNRPLLPLVVETPQETNVRLRQRRKVPKVNTRSNNTENTVASTQNASSLPDTSQNDQSGDQNAPSSTIAQIEEDSELDSEYSDDESSLTSDSSSTSSFACSDAIVFSDSDQESSRRELRSSQQNDGSNHAKNDRKSKRRLRKTKKLRQESLEEESLDENNQDDNESSQQPTTSTAAIARSERPKRTKKVRQEIYIPENLDEKKKIRRGQRVSLPTEPSCLTDVPEKYWFPDWITCTVPRKTPYFPQIKDQVVYFPLGHSLYIDVVERLDIYPIDSKTIPWKKHRFQDQEFAVILNVRFEITPIRLCCLKLAQINPITGLKTGLNYTIRYHDIPNVIDFIVLRHHYDQSLKRKWKEGDRFQAVIDDNWWFGTIIKKEAYDQRFPNSIFLSFKVLWDNGDEERLSPWDLELFNAKRCPVKKGTSISLSEEELCQLAAYEPKPEDWINDRERDIGRLCRALEQIAQFSFAEPFAAPVDLNAYPTYCLCVEYPSDLSTIKTRLDNYFYRRIQAVEFDIKQIHKNAVTFNEPRSQIVCQAKLICEVLLRFIRNSSCDDISQIYNEVTNEKPNQKEKCKILRKNKRSRRRKYISSKDDETEDEKPQIKGWLDACQRVLDEIGAKEAQNAASNANLEPSDSENSSNADDLATIINLKIIRENLINDRYISPHSFHEDLITYFNNKKVDKTSKRSKTYLNILRLKGVVSHLMQPIFNDFQMSVSYPQSIKTYNTRNKKIAFTQLIEGNYDSELLNYNTQSHQSNNDFCYKNAHKRNQPIEKRRRIVSDQSEGELEEKSINNRDQYDKNQKPSTSGISNRKISSTISNGTRATLKRKRDDGEKIDKLKINVRNLRQNYFQSSGEEDEGESSQNSTKFTSIKRKLREKKKIAAENADDDHISTRFRGKQTIKYAESSDEGDFDFDSERNNNEEDGPSIVFSTSSRGRICKLRKFT